MHKYNKRIYSFLLLILLGGSSLLGIAASSPTNTTFENAKQLYAEHCFVCHYAGGAGSPRVGDEKAWNPRIKKGKDELLKNTLLGLNFMPAKGLCNQCSKEELSAIIDYMISQCTKCDKGTSKK